MNSYARLLMQNWKGSSNLVVSDDIVGFVDQDRANVEFPVNEVTKNRDASIVRAMQATTPPIVRDELLKSIQTLPPDGVYAAADDDDKLTVMKSRYCQSRPEMADYSDYLQKVVDSGVPDPNTDPQPDPEPDPKPDPKPDPEPNPNS